MGLDFDHSNAHWSYGGFMRFRQRLATAIGLGDLETMYGFGGERSWGEIDDPLVPLLNHSDCDGELTAVELRLVSPRLRDVVSAWPEAPDNYDWEQALLLCDDMDALLESEGERALLRFI